MKNTRHDWRKRSMDESFRFHSELNRGRNIYHQMMTQSTDT